MYRKTFLKINLDAIKYNLEAIQAVQKKKAIAVLKANAYGCGAKEVSEVMVEAGVEMIAVSSLDEAIAMRNFGYKNELLILGHVDPINIPILIQNDISTTAYSFNWVLKAIKQNCKNLKIHLKIETGMNRIGFTNLEELNQAYDLLSEAGCLIEGIFTHFACAESDEEKTLNQFNLFKKAYESLNHSFKWIHTDNSYASVSFKDSLTNACRIGIGLYGYQDNIALKPALSLYSQIFYVKQVHKDETIGYGATYTSKEDIYVGTMPIGYADGFTRANQGRNVYIDGQLCEVVGRVCMDQTMIKLPSQIKEGSLVEIFGPHIPLEEMANDLNTIPYEIICLITSRVSRVYIKNNEVVKTENEYLDLSHHIR